MSLPPKPRENSRQYSPAFSRKVKASVLRTLARKADKYKEKMAPLIDCHDFDEAADRVDLCWPINHTWIATVDSLRQLRKTLNALDLGGS